MSITNFNFKLIIRFWEPETKSRHNFYSHETYHEEYFINDFSLPELKSKKKFKNKISLIKVLDDGDVLCKPIITKQEVIQPHIEIESYKLVEILMENDLKPFISKQPKCYEIIGNGHVEIKKLYNYEAGEYDDEEIYIDSCKFQRVNAKLVCECSKSNKGLGF